MKSEFYAIQFGGTYGTGFSLVEYSETANAISEHIVNLLRSSSLTRFARQWAGNVLKNPASTLRKGKSFGRKCRWRIKGRRHYFSGEGSLASNKAGAFLP